MKHSVRAYRRYISRLQKNGTRLTERQLALMAEHQCMNCGMTYVGNFCPCCGQSAKTARFTVKLLLNQLVFFFAKFDDKFTNTVKNLSYRPGYMIREYISGHRVNYMRPMQMLVCLVTIYALLSYFVFPHAEPTHFLNLEDETGKIFVAPNSPFIHECLELIEKGLNNTIVSTLSFVFLLTLASKITFCRTTIGKGLNLAEHFFILTYVACMNIIADFIFLPYNLMTHGSSSNPTIYFFILWWVCCQLYEMKKRKALLSVLLMLIITGFEIVVLVVAVIGILVSLDIINIPQ